MLILLGVIQMQVHTDTLDKDKSKGNSVQHINRLSTRITQHQKTKTILQAAPNVFRKPSTPQGCIWHHNSVQVPDKPVVAVDTDIQTPSCRTVCMVHLSSNTFSESKDKAKNQPLAIFKWLTQVQV